MEQRPKISYNHNPAAKETRRAKSSRAKPIVRSQHPPKIQIQMQMQLIFQNEMKLI